MGDKKDNNTAPSGSFYSDINPAVRLEDIFVPAGTGGVVLIPERNEPRKEPTERRLPVTLCETAEGNSAKRVYDSLGKDAGPSINDSHVTDRMTVNAKVSESRPKVDYGSLRKDKFLLYKKLPFIRRRMDFGTWVDRNKVAVSVTVMAYLVGLFAFASVRIDMSADKVMQGVLVEIAPEAEQEPEPEQETPEEEKKPAPAEVRDVRNAASNATARLDGGLKDDKGTKDNDIYKDAEQLDAKLAASRAAYERMESELAALAERPRTNNQRKGNQETERKQSRVSGNVTVEYDLEGRDAVYLPVPAYKCHNGGRVVVNITVNRSGNVVSASVDKSRSSDDPCLCENAVSAAKGSSFNAGTSFPVRQNGTITYLFLSQ